MKVEDLIKSGYDSENLESLLDQTPIGFLVFDEEDYIKIINESVFSFGLKHDLKSNIIGKKLHDIKLLEEFDLREEINALKNLDPFEKVIKTSKSVDGKQVAVIIKGTPIIEYDNYKGGILVFEDMKLGSLIQSDKIFKSDLFKQALSSVADSYTLINPSGMIIARNDSLHEEVNLFQESDGYLLNEIQVEDKSVIEKALGSSLREKSKKNITIVTNSNKNIDLSFTPLLNERNKIQYILVLYSDAENRLTKEKELSEKVEELNNYFFIANAITDAIVTIDLTGIITYWNNSATELFGVDKSEVFGKHIGKVLPNIDDDYLEVLKSELLEKDSWQGEFWTSESTKESELLSIRMALNKDEEYIVILCTSITERANIEKQLRVSEERFRSIVTNTKEYICTFNTDGKITYVNPFFSKEFGYSEAELLDFYLEEIVDNQQLEEENITFESLYQEQADSSELTLRKKDGSLAYVVANFTASKDLSGEISSYNAVFTDISEKKEVEKDLLMIKTVFEASQDGIAIQSHGRYILVNDSFANMFGYLEIDQVVGRIYTDFIADEDINLVTEYNHSLEQRESVPDRFVYRAKHFDGTYFFVEKSSSSYQTNEGLFIVSSFRDITKEKQAIDDLEVSEERYRSITENLNDCVWSAERKNNKLEVVFYSDVINKITGYSNDVFINDKNLWVRIIHPSDVEGTLSDLKSFYRDSRKASNELEYRIINNLGNIVWIKNKINVLRNNDGEIQKIFGLVSDITLSKRGEEELLKSTNELKALNETKDRFISIISHDLRTPFSSILGFTDMLLSDRNMSEDKQIQYISFIQESSRNMLSLVNSLLDWTRLQTGRIAFEPQRINSNYIVNKAIQMLSGVALQKNINLVSDLSSEVYVHADEHLLLQIFNNLISNAIKFTDQGGNITISSAPLVKYRQVQFKVRDNGVGIKEEDIPKLFKVDTKYTTNGTSGEKGSGLGLSLCYDIVKKHGGDIAVKSEYGLGTEFIFTIPVSSTKILLVDDSRNDRILYSKLIKNFAPDYSVDEAGNGREAYEIIKSSYPALIITDHNMPEMNGYSLVQQLNLSDLKYKPPIIVLSSDLDESLIKEYREQGVDFAFRKPVNLTTLKIAVEKSLKKAIFN
jgi:PAS domain S-box-containing protein